MVHNNSNLNYGDIWYNTFLNKYKLSDSIIPEMNNEKISFKDMLLDSEESNITHDIKTETPEFNNEYLKSKLDFRKKIIENILSEKGME